MADAAQAGGEGVECGRDRWWVGRDLALQDDIAFVIHNAHGCFRRRYVQSTEVFAHASSPSRPALKRTGRRR
jgi:hypothetical protein